MKYEIGIRIFLGFSAFEYIIGILWFLSTMDRKEILLYVAITFSLLFIAFVSYRNVYRPAYRFVCIVAIGALSGIMYLGYLRTGFVLLPFFVHVVVLGGIASLLYFSFLHNKRQKSDSYYSPTK